MARFLRLTDEDVELLFRGLPPGRDEDLRDLAGFLSSATQALARPPRKDVEARHLELVSEAFRARWDAPNAAAMTEARANRTRARRGLMRLRTVRWAARVGLATAAVVLMTGALAFAGVDLPGTAAETAFQKVLRVDLPNQGDAPDPAQLPPDASETARRVLTVIQEWRSGAEWSGCEFGARVSHAARGLDGEPDTSRCEGGGAGAAQGSPQGSHGAGVGASGNSEAGRGKANGASAGAASNGAEHAGGGRSNADDASAGAAGAGSNAGS